MRFSVVIPTCNRSALLIRAVRSIQAQDYPAFEIIISDDASVDDTAIAVKMINDQRVLFLRSAINRGLSATRNAALRKSRGEYVIFMDDDVTLKNDFLSALDKIIRTHNFRVLCPRFLDPETKHPFMDFFLNLKKRELGYFDFNCFLGGSHILSQEVIRKVGFYDERLGIGAEFPAAEESDYFFRLKKIKERIVYCPELVAYHALVKEQAPSKVFNYSYGISAVLMKNMLNDYKHWPYYFLIIARRVLVSAARSIQYVFFPKSIEEKNKKYGYKYFFQGTAGGILDCLKLIRRI